MERVKIRVKSFKDKTVTLLLTERKLDFVVCPYLIIDNYGYFVCFKNDGSVGYCFTSCFLERLTHKEVTDG